MISLNGRKSDDGKHFLYDFFLPIPPRRCMFCSWAFCITPTILATDYN